MLFAVDCGFVEVDHTLSSFWIKQFIVEEIVNAQQTRWRVARGGEQDTSIPASMQYYYIERALHAAGDSFLYQSCSNHERWGVRHGMMGHANPSHPDANSELWAAIAHTEIKERAPEETTMAKKRNPSKKSHPNKTIEEEQ